MVSWQDQGKSRQMGRQERCGPARVWHVRWAAAGTTWQKEVLKGAYRGGSLFPTATSPGLVLGMLLR